MKNKMTYQELEEQYKLYKLIADNTFDIEVFRNAQGKVLYTNKAFEKVSGYSSEDFINGVISEKDIVHPDDIAHVYKHQSVSFKSGTVLEDLEFRMITKSKEIRTLNLASAPVFDKTNKLIGFRTSIRDITESRLIKQLNELVLSLKQSEDEIKLLFDSLQDLIWFKNIKGEFLKCNNSFLNFYGVEYDKVIGKVESDFMKLNEAKLHISRIDELIKSKKQLIINEDKKRNFEGKEFIFETVKKPILDESNQLIGILCISRDITKRVENQKQIINALQAAEAANKFKTEFLHNISHEIRTPMNAIMGFSQILEKPNIDETRRKSYLKIIQNNSKQLLKIIEEIIEISNLDAKEEKIVEKEFCVNDFLTELYSEFSLKASNKGIRIYIKKNEELPNLCIISDRQKIKKILSNVIHNALKFTYSGYIEIGYEIKDSTIIFFVKDTGIGISTKYTSKVFERFLHAQEDLYTDTLTDQGGVGLGLPISLELAKLLGGNITFDSVEGKGTTFYVKLPFKQSKKSIIKTKDNCKNDICTVLIAEDVESNYLFLEALFEDEIKGKFNLIHAKNGKEALDIFTKNQDIDFILMDIRMPIMGGLEAAKKIKELNPTIPIIAQTAYSDANDFSVSLHQDLDYHITKPIIKDELVSIIKKCIKK